MIMLNNMNDYDCIIVGGGPAGLSAAIHLAWHKRKVLVLDRRTGPLFYTLTKLENVAGFAGQTGVQIMKSLRNQATSLGAEVTKANIISVSGELGNFELKSEKKEVFRAKTILLATGVARYHPTIDGNYKQCLAFAGKCNLFYCPDCEAPEIDNKNTLIIGTGTSAGAIGTAKHLWLHSKDLEILLTNDSEISEKNQNWLDENKIKVHRAKITSFEGTRGCMSAVLLDNGDRLEHEAFFVSSPKSPRTDLAQQLGIAISKSGHAEPKSQRGDTDIAGVWIAGDLRPMTQQVSISLGTGNIAAVHIDQFLAKHC